MESITAEELEKRIQEILEYGRLILLPHAKQRMAIRNYEMSDVLYILKRGKVRKFSQKGYEKYECEVYGEDLEGHNGTVIAIVIKNQKMIIVTVLGGV